MATWFSYGEDALTYWAFQHRLPDVLHQLNDDTPTDDVIVFYRPSFGRGGNTNSTELRAEFGEFDAILATPKSLYPFEAKWDASSERQGDTILIRDVQILRHCIFAW